MTAFEDLAGWYADRCRLLTSSRREGRPVVGLIGAGIPTELILAAGALPLAITPGPWRSAPRSEEYFDLLFGWSDRDLLETALLGDMNRFDLIVLTREHQHLFYYLKELYRRGELPGFPPIAVFDVLPSRREASLGYNRGEFALLKGELERLRGCVIEDGELADAIGLFNKVRQARRGVELLREQGRLSGQEALVLHGASAFMDPADYVRALDAALSNAPPASSRGPGVLVASAEPLSSLRLHEVIEAASGWVVAEDDRWGSRGAAPDIVPRPDPFSALVDSYLAQPDSVTAWPAELAHAWFTNALAKPQVSAVVFHAPLTDATFGWDIPHLKALAASAGKPCVLIQHNLTTDEGRLAAVAEVSGWLKTLAIGEPA